MCLFSCLFIKFETLADDPHLWVVHALIELGNMPFSERAATQALNNMLILAYKIFDNDSPWASVP
jgi:hypothetical protein